MEERRESHAGSSTSGKAGLGFGHFSSRHNHAPSTSPSGSPYRPVPGQARRFAKNSSRKESPFTGELVDGVPPAGWKERIGDRVYDSNLGLNGLNETKSVTVENGHLVRVSSTSRVMVSSTSSTVRIDQTTLVQLNRRPGLADERSSEDEELGGRLQNGSASQATFAPLAELAELGPRSQSLPVERSKWEDPGSPPLRQPLDRFGFFTPPASEQLEAATDGKKVEKKEKTEREREERRLRKWRKMIGAGGMEWKHYCKKKPVVVKRRIRKGIPDCLRGLVWQLVSGSRDLLLQNPGVYEQLVFYESSLSELDIIRDISRTFPSHVFYSQRHGPGQRSLYNVLKAYSVYDKEVGYVQGMGFLAGLLLLYMGEEDAFWLLVALLKGAVHAPMEGLFLVGLPLVQQYLFQFERLVQELFPRLGAHFEEECINPSMYASQWFITVFSYSFPFSLALRIWDVFLSEGMKVVFRVGLALLKQCHDDLLKMPFEKLVHALRNFPDELLDPDTLLPIAYSIKVSARLAQLKEEYDKLHNPQSSAPPEPVNESRATGNSSRDLVRHDSKDGSVKSGSNRSKSSDSLGE